LKRAEQAQQSLRIFILLELHADAVAPRQRVNLTRHRDIGDSLTGVVFK
jgi:hypothetical protein